MANSIQQTRDLGQSIWYDNVSRGLIASGAMAALVDAGITGLTSNPTIFEKAISSGDDYDEQLLALALTGATATGAFEGLAIEDIRAVADLLRPVYDATGGADGFASLEVSPTLAHDTEATVAEAQRLFAALDRPNVMIKVPGTPEGVPAVERLIGQGINVNVTLLFHRDAYSRVRDAYIAGLERLAESGGDLSRVASVASFFVSRVDTAVDGLLEPRVQSGEEELADLLGRAAIANAALAYRDFQQTVATQRFQTLKARGARAQRPLWASTGTKNAAYSDVLYIDSLIAPDTVNTMPPATLDSYLDHGRVELSLEPSIPEAERVMQALEDNGVSMTEVTDKLLADGVKAFADSFVTLLANVEEKKAALLAAHYAATAALGESQPAVDDTVADLVERDAVRRIWDADHTLWKPDPTEIADRLGWLTLPTDMRAHVEDLRAFADEVRGMGVDDVVLLGMGGSSRGAAALRTVFGEAEGRPRLTVLDTTVPGWIAAARDAIDVRRALFLVSSKSGGTLETLTGYRYFRSLADAALGEDAGRRFVAITDAGSGLERLARDEGFLRTFLNPETIGGRYSVLSFFGLVPAVLTGIAAALLDRAALMQAANAPGVPAEAHPGLQLGAAIGALAKAGRDKLTFVTTPGLGRFGLWAEQLIAESLGKEGVGIVPIAEEPLLAPERYGSDRVFAYLRLDGDDAQATDDALAALEAAGHPVLRFRLRDRYDLAAEMYRWEFATAVAGAVLGVNPFDQPNVQGAKDKTAEVLAAYERDGALPEAGQTCTFDELLAQAAPGDYLCVMAYVRQTPAVDAALAALRRRVMERHAIATTAGYGPRFLHSTGQLHKGGPATGLFLQVTADHAADIEIPGQGYSFGTLADAQALGDLQALQAAGLRVARVHITGDVSEGLAAL
ncbi:MAG: bifunctional transaldolase/phosoglucose isomerase [Chloroflexota bacterium]|nr:bifunctional transaldolase/phosoglucose isomerase [Chloroflexota bacterium]